MKNIRAPRFIDSCCPGFGWARRAFGISALLLLASLFPSVLSAHHGRDFLLVQDSAIPARFSGVLIGGYSWSREGDDDTFSTEPGLYIGLTSALAFGLTASFSDAPGDWSYDSVMPQFVLSLLPPTGDHHFRIGLWTGYDIAEDHSPSTVRSGRRVAPPGGGGPDGGPDGKRMSSYTQGDRQPAHAGHFGSQDGFANQDGSPHGRGINRHGESGLYTRLIFEADLTDRSHAVANLISFVPQNGSQPGFGYAVGLRYAVHHDLSFGIESLGEFLTYGSSHEVMLTTMVGLPRHLSLRLGFGGGLTGASPDISMHAGLLWRF
jgi:hypothetical protein